MDYLRGAKYKVRAHRKLMQLLVAIIALAAAPTAVCVGVIFIEGHTEKAHMNALPAGQRHLCIDPKNHTLATLYGNRGES